MTKYELSSASLSAVVDSQGAELQSLRRSDGLELLWQANPAVWARHAPHLFPIVGRLRDDHYIHDGRRYRLTQHGFARDSTFELVEHTPHRCTLLLRDSSATREHYPFAFELRITHALEGTTLTVIYTVRNPSDGELFVSLGAHPAFNWPLVPGNARSAHTIAFPHAEALPVRRLHGGLMSDIVFDTPVRDSMLHLRDELFTDDVIIFDRLQSRSLMYGAPGGPQLHIDFADFPHLGLWTKPGAGFICIEPWQGHACPQDFDGEFARQPGVARIAPRSERNWSYSISAD